MKKQHFRDGVKEYLKRIGRYTAVEAVEVKEEGGSIKTPKDDVLKKEAERILKKLKPSDYKVVLADSGKEMTSHGLAAFVEGHMSGGKKGIAFIIGGAYGLHKTVYEQADATLSLSKMTLPHELAYLVLTEQVYRAFTILKGEPYSH